LFDIPRLVAGLSYCFANQEAKTAFMQDPTGNLAKAKAFYSTKHPS
jgi:YHS domain-containing protein